MQPQDCGARTAEITRLAIAATVGGDVVAPAVGGGELVYPGVGGPAEAAAAFSQSREQCIVLTARMVGGYGEGGVAGQGGHADQQGVAAAPGLVDQLVLRRSLTSEKAFQIRA